MASFRGVLVVVLLVSLAAADRAYAQAARGSSAITCGIRQRVERPEIPEYPFGDSDLTYLIAYEYREGDVSWELGLGYTPHSSATSSVETVESVLTPQLHLLYEQGALRMGIGVLKHYASQSTHSTWSDLLWEFEIGLHFPVSSSLDVQALAFYDFAKWGDLGDFDTRRVELGLNVSYRF